MKRTMIRNTYTITTKNMKNVITHEEDEDGHNQEHTSKITTSNMKRMIMTMKMVVTKNT